MLTVKIELLKTSQPILVKGALNTYEKGKLFCIIAADKTIFKFPIMNIFRITEKGEK